MIRLTVLSCALVASVVTPSIGVLAAPAPRVAEQARQATAADAAPFVGDWTLTLQGPNGPGAFDLSVKVEGEKVLARPVDCVEAPDGSILFSCDQTKRIYRITKK